MPEIGEKERNYYLFEIIQTKVLRIPTNTHSPSFSLCPVWGTLSQERSRSPWFRLSAPSTWQKKSTSKAAWSWLSPKPHGPKQRRQMPACLGLNPSANLPLQPHFQLLPQLATAASIPGRCGPVVWSQLSPSSSGPRYKSLFGSPLLAAPCYTTTPSPCWSLSTLNALLPQSLCLSPVWNSLLPDLCWTDVLSPSLFSYLFYL